MDWLITDDPMHYNRALDGVRALAILAVVSFHCVAPWGSGGFLGVDVFFVLSGYLITTLLAAEHRKGSIDIGAFYARRALRLYPSLLLVLCAYLALAPILWPTDERWLVAALNGLYLMDYALAFSTVPGTIGHTWSLGVEEKFYLLWPLVLPILLRTRRPISWLLAAFVAATLWRYFVTFEWGWRQAYFRFDTRMSGILLGAIAALVPVRVSRPTIMIACTALAIAIMVPIIATTTRSVPVEGVTIGVTLAELSAFVLICYVKDHPNSSLLASGPVAYIGKLSYGIYLWHFPLVLLLRDVHAQPWWLTLSATLLFSFAMAALCLHLVDTPLKQWRERREGLKTGFSPRGAET
ncbi:acyltransferase family protein [Peristeroidobacter agariperforans]|uniref:acyltransferase family protein n=1 Tax=Peristeroidobacter agariperforans TaxID=268404 RepID=UPI0018E545E5|nr:acyltransferase [Peristeroidobacter agariperforans]